MSHAPSFMRAPAPVRSRRGEWIALVLLALALLAQLFFSQRAQLAADARWRPLVLSACGALRCSVPAWREPGAFSMLSRVRRSRPAFWVRRPWQTRHFAPRME